jgi:hypothetical protein
MGCKLFVALQLEVAHQFIERFAGGRTRGFEPPATFGATKTLKTLLLNPYQLPAHGHLCRCAPTSTRLLSRDETFWFAIKRLLSQRRPADCSKKNVTRSGRGGRCIKRWAKFTWANLDGLSGILHTGKSCSCERLTSAASFEVSGIALSVGHASCLAMLAALYRTVMFGKTVDPV